MTAEIEAAYQIASVRGALADVSMLRLQAIDFDLETLRALAEAQRGDDERGA